MTATNDTVSAANGEIGRMRAVIEAIVVLLTVIPAILIVAVAIDAVEIDSPALPALGIYASILLATYFLRKSGSD